MKTRIVVILVAVASLLGAQPAAAQQRHGDGVDDVLQYLPMASVYVLKLCGVERRKSWPLLTGTVSMLVSAGVAYGLKLTVKEWRPDNSDRRSFPSGHTTLAFAGATVLHKEFGHHSPWISVGGYAVATAVAVDRVAKDRHHWYDVAAGAAIGFLSTQLVYCLSEKIFMKDNTTVAVGPTGIDVAYVF